MKTNYTLQEFFIKAPIGFSEVYTIVRNGTFIKDEYVKLKTLLSTEHLRITAPCILCGKEFPFNYRVAARMPGRSDSAGACIDYAFGSNCGGFREYYGFDLDESTSLYRRDAIGQNAFTLIKETKYLFYDFQCAGDENHHYEMLIRVDIDKGEVRVTKVGQHPFPHVLNADNFSAFERLLEKTEAKEDFRRANKSFFDGMYVGALIYLRRVFEKMVDYLTGPDVEKNVAMPEKLRLVKGKIDPEIYDHMHGAYEMISEHIHNRSETECKDIYDGLMTLICDQLTYMKTEAERAASRKQAKSKIDIFLRKKRSDRKD